ncbi:hypothetical protein L249_1048 [Ophiocordyceps polyrhachis-furcata BCC 54312]|uniref:Uncharacterized protein n=1 Tax=Ophiocordyceps polyrhachis-furcata BCC 54312 TaxID=1330021 RepID=A0A367LEB4_9HYPO|nr:hypothetical protein L249_1048 [Ophiocordyceps polyrhachis-furcata BCC 54312]
MKDGHVDLDLATATGADGREANVGVGDLVRHELRPQPRARRREVGECELATAAETGKGGQGDGVLVRPHVILGDATPQLHVGLDVEELLEANAPRLAGCSFEHEAAELGMKDGSRYRLIVDVVGAASVAGQVLARGQRIEDLGLTKREEDSFVVGTVIDDQIFDLHSITLLSLGLVPDLEQLLRDRKPDDSNGKRARTRTYLNAPVADLMSPLPRLRPLKSRAERPFVLPLPDFGLKFAAAAAATMSGFFHTLNFLSALGFKYLISMLDAER